MVLAIRDFAPLTFPCTLCVVLHRVNEVEVDEPFSLTVLFEKNKVSMTRVAGLKGNIESFMPGWRRKTFRLTFLNAWLSSRIYTEFIVASNETLLRWEHDSAIWTLDRICVMAQFWWVSLITIIRRVERVRAITTPRIRSMHWSPRVRYWREIRWNFLFNRDKSSLQVPWRVSPSESNMDEMTVLHQCRSYLTMKVVIWCSAVMLFLSCQKINTRNSNHGPSNRSIRDFFTSEIRYPDWGRIDLLHQSKIPFMISSRTTIIIIHNTRVCFRRTTHLRLESSSMVSLVLHG